MSSNFKEKAHDRRSSDNYGRGLFPSSGNWTKGNSLGKIGGSMKDERQ